MNFTKNRILVIDDDPSVCNILMARLSKKDGHDVSLAEDGEGGFELAQKEMPDLILLDWMMPGISGIETLQKLKETKKTREIPVYMLTGKNVMEDIERAFDAGADGYFTKPIKVKDLSKRLLIALNNINHEK